MSAPKIEIIVTVGGAEHARFVCDPGQYVIGRDEECFIRLDAGFVSGKHAKLTLKAGEAFIEDLGGGIGTLVNGRAVTGSTRLWPNQKIQVGGARIELRRLKIERDSDELPDPDAAAVRALLPEASLREKKYDINGVVAEGGMGVILDAREATTKRTVAMKVMLGPSSSDAARRFVREATVTAQLEHPNIIPVHELSVDENDHLFYTMKLVKGITLWQVLKDISDNVEETIRKYPLAVLLTIFQKVCDALAFAHSKNVIHRDLKPENVMLGDYGEVLVMDWGLAKILDAPEDAASAVPKTPAERNTPRPESSAGSKTAFGTMIGTPQFMSPEQARGETNRLDPRSDIYALGGILFQILTLRPPVEGRTVDDVLAKVESGNIETPLEATARSKRLAHLPTGRVPESLSAVAAKAMALEPSARYQSVPELQQDIEAYQHGFATGAENAGAWKQFTLLIKRNKVLAASAALIAALTVGFLIKVVASEKRALANEKRALDTLNELRGTAPTFAAQAGSLIESQNFDEALKKILYAIEIDETNPDYHLFRANTLQALARLRDAAASYRRVLALRDGDAVAKLNLDLCEQLLAENRGKTLLTVPLKTRLLDSILAQKRQADAVPLSRELHRDMDTADALIKSRLKAVMAQPGWDAKNLGRWPNGTFRLVLTKVKVPDLGILAGLPISRLEIRDFSSRDLAPLSQVRLKELVIQWMPADVSLKGLRSETLERIDLSHGKLTDISPLAGMPLKTLSLFGCPVRSLKALHGMPIEELVIGETKVESLEGLEAAPLRTLAATRAKLRDIALLRTLPITQLDLTGCSQLRDLSPLEDCQRLETLLLPSHLSDIAFLKELPNLKRISYKSISDLSWDWETASPAADFWQKNGERLARQAPIEKQLEKFRAYLITAGNLPSKIPYFCFDFDGALVVEIPSSLTCPDISTLRGASVTRFVSNRGLGDISALAGAPLGHLTVMNSALSDLSPIRGAPLTEVILSNTRVSDLSPLRGMPLRKLWLNGTPITDVAILAEFPTLEEIILPAGAKHVEPLRRLPKLSRLSYRGSGFGIVAPDKPVAEFWKEFDAKMEALPK